MSQLILARGAGYRRNFFKKFMPNFQLGPYFLIGSLVVFVALITVITLMFSTRQVTKGYVLSLLDSKHAELIRESERKDMQISEVRALKFIENSPKVRSMVIPSTSKLVFVSGQTAIAKK